MAASSLPLHWSPVAPAEPRPVTSPTGRARPKPAADPAAPGSSCSLASVPLFSVLYMLISRGGARLEHGPVHRTCRRRASCPAAASATPSSARWSWSAIASLISIPIGVLAAAYLSYLGPSSRLTAAARFLSKVLTGFPSILAGVFGFAILVLTFGTYSAIAGGVALAVLMLPTVILTADKSMRTVPTRMKEAAVGIGCTPTQVVVEGRAADGPARHPHRHHPGHRPRRRRIGAAAVHRAVQQLLAAPACSSRRPRCRS